MQRLRVRLPEHAKGGEREPVHEWRWRRVGLDEPREQFAQHNAANLNGHRRALDERRHGVEADRIREKKLAEARIHVLREERA